MSVWASVPDARLAAWTPDGALLVSRPGEGQVVRLAPNGNTATSKVLLDGLTQPHGLAFDGTTLYVAESDRIRAYTYADGRGHRTARRRRRPSRRQVTRARWSVRARAQERGRRP